MTRLYRALGIVGVCLAGFSCGARHLATKHLNGLPPCSRGPAIPADWQRVDSAVAEFSIALPRGCHVDDGERPGVHRGGQRWLCDQATVEVVWGMWGPDSFAAPGERCRAREGGMGVMRKYSVIDGRPHALTWYLSGGPHEPIIAAHASDANGGAVVRLIANSGRMTSKN